MKKLMQECNNLIEKAEAKKLELFKKYLDNMKEKYILDESDDDFNSYEDWNHDEDVYKVLNTSLMVIDDYFDTEYFKTFSSNADADKESTMLSESENSIRNIIPNINKDELAKLLSYIEEQKED